MLSPLIRIVTIAALMVPAVAVAQEWPSKQPVRVIVPFSAGSATDIVARTVFEQVGKQVGQTFVVENRGGAGTTIGMGMVAKAEPDGYTILVNSTSHVVVASTYAKLPFHPLEIFETVAMLASMPYIVATSTKYKSMQELIKQGKAQGSTINYGSAGAGSSGQLFMESVRLAGGFPATHIPFRGTPEGMNELVAGRIDMYAAPTLSALSLAKKGLISTLAVSSKNRLALMPEVPTLIEAGLPDALYNFWVGVFLPAKTPDALVERINREIQAALKVKATADRIAALGGEAMPMSPAEAETFAKSELKVNADIVKASGFKPQ